MKKAIGIIVVIIVVVLLAVYFNGGLSNQTAINEDSAFANDAAVILAQPNLSSQAKIDALKVRLEARKARALKTGGSYRIPPISGVTK